LTGLLAGGRVGQVEVLGTARAGGLELEAARLGSVRQRELPRREDGRLHLVAVHGVARPGAVAASGGGGQGETGKTERAKAGHVGKLQGGETEGGQWSKIRSDNGF
jgi:hypothetical protein